MARPQKLDDADIGARLKDLPGWSLVEGKLHREVRLADFQEAFGFMARMAMVSESLSHHPEWFNVWNRVVIDLNTHDAGGLTDLDFEWAKRANAALGNAR